MGHRALRETPHYSKIKANRRISNVEGMYSVYFIKKKKAGINPATTGEPQSKSSGGVYPRP